MKFAVPGEKTLLKEGSKFRLDADETGIMKEALELFASVHQNEDIKLAFDGKKITQGYGKNFGEEDLGGYEEAPTLKARRLRLEDELKSITDSLQYTVNKSVENDSEPNQLNCDEKDFLKSSCYKIIGVLSRRVQELRQHLVKKRNAVQNLLKRVTEDNWMKSELSGCISYIQTIIIRIEACMKELLDCIDDIGCYVACLNNSRDYHQGSGVFINLEEQHNYTCLKEEVFLEPSKHDLDDLKASSHLIKQRSKAWHLLRNKALFTGSTLYNATGQATLKEQQQHYDHVFKGKDFPKASDEVQKNLEYGTENEIHAIATLVGKIMPVYQPNLIYSEDGCLVVNLDNSTFAIISGDGSAINQIGESATTYEVKCPVPDKKYTTDVYYKLPVRYTTQLLSQMSAKKNATMQLFLVTLKRVQLYLWQSSLRNYGLKSLKWQMQA